MAEQFFSAVIMAAGISRRMGVPKLSLPFDESRSFVQRCVQVFADFPCREISVVVNDDGMKWLSENDPGWPANVHVVLNQHPEKGRFFSLQKGLEAIRELCPVFVHNVDNPFINTALLQQLASVIHKASFIRPVCGDKRGHPALISKKAATDILHESNPVHHVRLYLEKYPQQLVTVTDPNTLVNINTPAEYHQHFKGLSIYLFTDTGS
ncbi:MAG: hypothetical protein EA394_03480 [Bacteroidia bacterium]|nr:MAG: hypothetical protein EA394_03480 [Bacteroidia bacterium]